MGSGCHWTYFCWFVVGDQRAMAVSLIGLKNMEPSIGDTARPIPCDDFLPTNLTGSSAPKARGPFFKAEVCTENILQMKN